MAAKRDRAKTFQDQAATSAGPRAKDGLLRRAGLHGRLAVVAALLLAARPLPTQAQTATVGSGDGLALTLSETDGAVVEIELDDTPLPLLSGAAGLVAMRTGARIPPAAATHLDFNAAGGPWTSARNADWDGAGNYATWIAAGEGGYLQLGDGATTGAGMAMSEPAAVPEGSALRISWRARSASLETTQILCVRIYDAAGADITSTVAAPPGWGWTATSQAHGVWGLQVQQPDAWEEFDRHYRAPAKAAFVRVSLRHWTGGDHLLDIDDLRIDVVGGIAWSERTAVRGAMAPVAGGWRQTAVAGGEIQVVTDVLGDAQHVQLHVALQDLSSSGADRPIQLYLALPVNADGWLWWDDIDSSRVIAPGAALRNTFDLAGHAISLYPYGAITSADHGIALGVPMDEPLAQRFEYDPAGGLQSVWELALSPATTKLGPGRAAVSAVIYRHDAAWGFRAATQKYQRLFPEYFVKRHPREGAWMYPVRASQIPNPSDFGFAYFETFGLDAAERALCAQHGIGVFYYTEPWLAWQSWGDHPEKPTYAERVALLERWAAAAGNFATWMPDGGVGGSGHLLLGDGVTNGAGMALAEAFPVVGGHTVNVAWQARVADTGTSQIVSVRVFDQGGNDITSNGAAPAGWFWSATSRAHVAAGIVNQAADTWEALAIPYVVPPGAAGMRVAVRHWTGGDHLVQLDDLALTDVTQGAAIKLLDFDSEAGDWVSALNHDWENAGPVWSKTSRQQAALAVINASPLDADGRYLIDMSNYLWHEWAPESWNQAWPGNPDPDLPAPNLFDLRRENWIHHDLDLNDGVYIDSVTTSGGVGNWENRRADHLAWSDSPLTFSWDDGGAAQLAPQAQAEFLGPIAAEVRGLGKVMMLNLFPRAMRFHAHHADTMGSEIFDLVESGWESRLRRTLAGSRLVSNLLQWGWDSPDYATYEQMEQFIRGQLFWGFYPAVSSAGGLLAGGTPDRYFLHPELYERDRPLFQSYIPVIRRLSAQGWEPVTHATADAGAQIERFGDFSRGPVLLTVCGVDGAALQALITLELDGCGLGSAAQPDELRNVLADEPVAFELLDDPTRARFAVALAAGEVGVYQLTRRPEQPGDFDADGDVDPADYVYFAECLAGPIQAPAPQEPLTPDDCLNVFDFDADADVDLLDFAGFLHSFTQ